MFSYNFTIGLTHNSFYWIYHLFVSHKTSNNFPYMHFPKQALIMNNFCRCIFIFCCFVLEWRPQDIEGIFHGLSQKRFKVRICPSSFQQQCHTNYSLKASKKCTHIKCKKGLKAIVTWHGEASCFLHFSIPDILLLFFW